MSRERSPAATRRLPARCPGEAASPASCRLLPRGLDWADVVVSHISANFDRSGLADDPNVAMPLDRLEDLAATGEIGGVSRWHYTLMGAHPLPQTFEETGAEVGRLLAEDAPGAGPEAWACPLNLAVEPDDSLAGRLSAGVSRLRPRATETRRRRGRTLFGLSGAAPGQVDDVATVLAVVAESGKVTEQPEANIDWAHPMPFLLRHLSDDLRGYYHEAIAAQPGDTPPNHDALNAWIFGETVLGEVLLAIGDHLTAAADTNPMSLLVRNFVIPEGHYRGVDSVEGIPGGYERTS